MLLMDSSTKELLENDHFMVIQGPHRLEKDLEFRGLSSKVLEN